MQSQYPTSPVSIITQPSQHYMQGIPFGLANNGYRIHITNHHSPNNAPTPLQTAHFSPHYPSTQNTVFECQGSNFLRAHRITRAIDDVFPRPRGNFRLNGPNLKKSKQAIHHTPLCDTDAPVQLNAINTMHTGTPAL